MNLKKLFAKKEPEKTEKPSMGKGEIGLETSLIYQAKDFRKYNPDKLLYRKGHDVYQHMLYDEQVKAVMQFKLDAITSRNYYFEKDPDNPQHEEIEAYFKAMIKNIDGNFTDNLQNILSALKFGYSISEKIFTTFQLNGKEMWGTKDLKLRNHDSFYDGFRIDKHGNILEIVQTVEGVETSIPKNKIIHFVHQSNIDSQYGESDLRAAYRSWWSKDIAIKFQNIHLERHAGGFLYGQYEGVLGATQKADLKSLVKNVSARMGALVPKNVDLKLFLPVKTDAYERAVAQHDKGIAKAILVPNLLGLSEQGQTGSFAQSQTQLGVFFLVEDTITKRLEQAINEQWLKELSRVNFGTDDFPWFKFEELSREQKIEMAKVWGELVRGRAVTKSDTDESHIRKMLYMPEKSEDAEELPEDDPGGIGNNPGQEVEDKEGGAAQAIEVDPKDKKIDKKDEDKKGEYKRYARRAIKNPAEARVDFKTYSKEIDTTERKYAEALAEDLAPVLGSIEKQISKIVGKRSLGNCTINEFKNIKFPPKTITEAKNTIVDYGKYALNTSYNLAFKELPQKLIYKSEVNIPKIIKPGKDIARADKFLAQKSFWIKSILERQVLTSAQSVLVTAIKYDKTLKKTIYALEAFTDLIAYLPLVDAAGRVINIPARLENIARTNTGEAINEGRMSLFTHPDVAGFIQSFQYSAIMDDRISEICEALDGRIKKDWSNYAPTNHYQCRSILVPVTTVDDWWDGKEDNIPAGVKPLKGFG